MRRTFIAPISFGLGDLVVSLPAVQALVRTEPSVWLVARAPSQRLLAERIEGLAGVVDEASFTRPSGDRLIDLRDHALQRDFWWGSAAFEEQFGPLDINGILERICADFGIDADFSLPAPLQANARPDLEGTVLLVHETDGADKAWPPDRWAGVAEMLRAEGHSVAQVTKEGTSWPGGPDNLPVLVAATPGAAVDALSSCRGVIGVDTGLTHIAAQQGRPTITICKRSSVYFRPFPHCAALRGERCTQPCLAAEEAYAYNETVSLRDFRPRARACPSGSPCLASRRAEDAVDLLRGLL
ncbi:MAG TPA: glycosyltransferase family 9 protein [Acidimicrobiales bacterium]|nr:glycosyltransferase family 9 protein [Acidimicrobiales bacterium]